MDVRKNYEVTLICIPSMYKLIWGRVLMLQCIIDSNGYLFI